MNSEKLLILSPTLALSLGVEEALLYGLFQEISLLQENPIIQFSGLQKSQLLPFWDANKFSIIISSLQAQGALRFKDQEPCLIELRQLQPPQKIAPQNRSQVSTPIVQAASSTQGFDQSTQNNRAQIQTQAKTSFSEPLPVFAMNEARQRNQYDDDLAYLKPESSTPSGKAVKARRSKITEEWEPTEEFPQLLSFHDIPLTFALSEIAKFRQYYLATDRTEISWDVRFLNWVQRAWHDSLNSKGRNERQQQNSTGEPENNPRAKRTRVRDALRNISDTDW